MQISFRCIFIVFFLSLFLFTGCSTTKVTSTWKNSGFSGQPFASILVVGLTGDPGGKFLWENSMATRLRKAGVPKVITTFNAFPNEDNIDVNRIVDYVTTNNIGAVLVTRLVDTKKETTFHPPPGVFYSGTYAYYSSFNSYYAHAFNRRQYTNTKTVALLETNLYQVKDQELVWSMTSDTIEEDYIQSVRQMADSASKKVLETLKEHKLI